MSERPAWAAPPLEEMISKQELEAVEYDVKCADCGAKMRLRFSSKHEKFARNRRGRKNKKTKSAFYGCSAWPECSGTHGAHADGRPLGIPANKETKSARIRAHAAFDHLWKDKDQPFFQDRGAAYAWLGETMDLEGEDAHIGRFDTQQCEQLVAAVLIEFDIDADDLT
jgi:hypothetical protein